MHDFVKRDVHVIVVISIACVAVALSACNGNRTSFPSASDKGMLTTNGDLLYTQAGSLINIGGRNINMYCIGSGSPTVVFDAGWEDWSPAWATIQPTVAKWTRACSYDRAGAGFSDLGPLPRSSLRIAQDLHSALQMAGIAGPYVLVAHSFGSFNMRMFADMYMNEVAGLVVVDGSDDDLVSENPSDAKADRRAVQAAVAELLACGDAVLQHHALPTLAPRMGRPGRPCDQQFFRGLPEKKFSSELNGKLLSEVLQSNKQYIASASELGNFFPNGPTIQLLRSNRRSFGDRPVRILTALNHYYDTAQTPAKLRAKHAQEEREGSKTQALLLSLSSDSRQLFAPQSGHYIQFDDPSLVLSAICDVIDRSTSRASGGSPRCKST
jgi:pimeloyl-ACP methyl ester carboxylesterase